MTDLSERDLSRIPDAKLTPEEREELQRRLGDFLVRLRARHGKPEARKPGARRIQPWDPGDSRPPTLSRRLLAWARAKH